MAEYIKTDNIWKPALTIYKKIDNAWIQQQESIETLINDTVVFYDSTRIDTGTLIIIANSSYTGKSFQISAEYSGISTRPFIWSIIAGNGYAAINQNGKVTIEPGAHNNSITVQVEYDGLTATQVITVSYDNQLVIEGPNEIHGTTGNVIARYNGNVVTPTWSITAGNNRATIDATGQITLRASGYVQIQAEYLGYTTTKGIIMYYATNSTTETTIDENGTVTTETTTTMIDAETGAVTTTTETTTTNEDGSSSTTQAETTTNEDGSSTSTSTTIASDGSTTSTETNVSAPDEHGSVTTEETSMITNSDGTSSESTSTLVENQDGSSQSTSTVINYDENGVTTGSVSNETTNNADGSYDSTTTSLNADGNPTDTINQNGDVSGNVSTQTITYTDEGDPVVTGYDIDTSNSDSGSKTFNGDGVNTEYYAFDLTHGFVIDFHFNINFAQQPAGQNENHHNILTMKRATPEPWYGFQLRHSSTNKNIILGTQFSSGSNTNTNILPIATVNNLSEYNLKIIYDPTLSTGAFKCINMANDSIIYQSDRKFPDLPELRYLKVTIGYALDANGDPYRYSNINVLNFSINKLHNICDPVISCDGQYITITCDTSGASIFYKLNQTGSFVAYTEPISIHADTIVEAYSQLDDEISNTVSSTCIYDNGIEEPVISCDDNYVTITAATPNSVIYYRLHETGNYVIYTTPISISEDTIVEAYAMVGSERSDIVSENCLFDSGIEDPIISCDGEYVTIMCGTSNADIWYRIDQTGNFELYTSAIELSATVLVEAYAEIDGVTSHTVSTTCTYDPIILVAPSIICNGSQITLSCSTANAAIYYKLNQTGDYLLYNQPIPILEDTFIEAYSTIRGKMSTVVSDTCIYDPIHDYSQDYLTFRILSAGTVAWNSIGSGQAKTIEYSLNNGAWTSIMASSSTAITVAANDVIRFRGNNTSYAKDKSNYSGFEGGTATFNAEGNMMSLIYGDNFANNSTLTGTYNFCSMFKLSNIISAENLVLPTMVLTQYCYRAMFSLCTSLNKAPKLPATTLAQGVYWYMFEECAITEAPELPALELVRECYGYMFTKCRSLNYIKAMAISGFSTTNCKQGWVSSVASSGTFVKDSSTSTSTWTRGNNGIPTNWLVYDDVAVIVPTVVYDGFSTITLTCDTAGASIYYCTDQSGNYVLYTNPISINSDTTIQAYSTFGGQNSRVITQTCTYVSDVPIEESNRDLKNWQYNGQQITTPYSVNRVDGHSSSYAKGTFNFETSFALRQAQPTYLWFQHADQSATVYIDDVLVEKHWGGYNAFFVDVSNFIHSGNNVVKVALKNNEGNYLAPAAGDFNFNATLGNVKLLTSPVLPATNYGYDGFHITSTVSQSSATIYVKTAIPIGASVECIIDDGTYHYMDVKNSTGEEMTFYTTITNPHLWNGLADPHLYTVTMNIYYNNELYHTFSRGYGLRYYDYVFNDTSILQNGDPYTGFLLNGSPYLLRGVCMHDDLDGKANALNDDDYTQEFSIIQELGCNFIRLAHYPHPKEVYDWCDRLGIIVQTEVPCVNNIKSTMPEDYYTHLEGQYRDMVNQHYNHPCIMFWGLSNETQVDDKDFAKAKAEGYRTIIKGLDPERWVGYVVAQSANNPSAYYNNPNLDWFGSNIYIGWYTSPDSNDPTYELNRRVQNTIVALNKPLAYSEYGCGGTRLCHSDDFLNTTTRGNHERHDIEYMMWLHEGQLASIHNFPQLLFTAEWQLFDIAVSNRNEGYTVCVDGETATTDDNLRRLNDKGLVERDHRTKKDTFYLYKAEWNPQPFVHICGKDYTKKTDRVIKCYSNDGNSFSLKLTRDGATMTIDTATATNNIITFTAQTFLSGDTITVEGNQSSDTFTFE